MIATTTYTRLTNAPVTHVLVQVSFSPVLDIGDSIAEVQNGLRSLGFAKLKVGQIQQLMLQGGAPAKVETRPQWEFLNRDDSLSLVVSHDFVTLQTSRYEHFPAFSHVLRSVLDVLARTTEVSWLTRVGLRYINLVRLKGREAYAEWLQRELLAFPFDAISAYLTGTPQFATQSTAPTEFGTLLIRTYQLASGQFVPPDLAGNSLRYVQKDSNESGAIALDIDHFAQLNTDFDAQAVVRTADNLHRLLKIAFLAAITPYAIQNWGPEEIVNAG